MQTWTVDEDLAGRLLKGRTYDEIPPGSQNPVAERKKRLAMVEKMTVKIA